LFELTKPANVSEGKLLIPMVKRLKEQIEIFPQPLIADANYNYETNLKFIIQKLKEEPIIARNLRSRKHMIYWEGIEKSTISVPGTILSLPTVKGVMCM